MTTYAGDLTIEPADFACSRRPSAARLIPALDANERKVMRNRIVGGIAVVWGGGMLVSFFLRTPEGSGAYEAGRTAALVFAVLLVVVGGYYLLKGSGKKL